MEERRFALIVASFKYEDVGLSQLIAPPQDAESLARVLRDPSIGGFEVKTLLNEPSYKINQEIEVFFSDRKLNDLLLVYFSSHGIKDSEGRLHFATINTRRNLLHSTAVSANLVNDVMLRSRSKQQILLLDCCYSGAFARGMLAKSDKTIGVNESFNGKGRIILTASNSMQYAFEGDSIEGQGAHSIFTKNLIHGLESGKADTNGDGKITVNELYDYVYDTITSETSQQKPEKWDLGVQGNIVIAHNPNPIVKPALLPSELRESISDLRPWVREGAVRQLNRLMHAEDKSIILAAQNALKQMVNDDSLQVRQLVNEILEHETTKKDESKSVELKEEQKREVINELSDTKVIEENKQSKIKLISNNEEINHNLNHTTTTSSLTSTTNSFFHKDFFKFGSEGWSIWRKWTFLNTVSFLFFSLGLVGYSWYFYPGDMNYYMEYDRFSYQPVIWLTNVGTIFVFPLLLGIIQWNLMRKYSIRITSWILATVLGYAASYSIMILEIPFHSYWIFLFYLLQGSLVGLAQSFVLRKKFAHSGKWIIATIIGWLFLSILFISVPSYWFFIYTYLFIVVVLGGLMIGTISGIFLVRLVKNIIVVQS